jgi:hypothetical protein
MCIPENIVSISSVILFFSTMGLGILVYSNSKKLTGREAFLEEMFAIVHILITSRFLNDTGRKYRPFFLVSAGALCMVVIFESYYTCEHIKS